MNGKLEQAIEAIKAGDKKRGREIIAEILKVDRDNEQAWLWVTQTDITHEQRIKSFKHVLRINPNNKTAKQQLAKLQGKQSQISKKKKKRKPIVNLALFGVVSVALVFLCLLRYPSSTSGTSSTSSPRLGSTPISTDTPKPTPTATRVVPPTATYTQVVPPTAMNTQPAPTATATPTRVIKPLSTNTPIPQAPSHPSGATAVCRDGTYSFSTSRRGTCSHHGGVSRWLE